MSRAIVGKTKLECERIPLQYPASRWRLTSRNGKIVDAGTESFSSRAACRRNLERIRDSLCEHTDTHTGRILFEGEKSMHAKAMERATVRQILKDHKPREK